MTSASQSAGPGAPVLAEVVARLGERVVDVQHLGVEPDPAITPAGWCTVGACAMVLGLGLLVAGVSATPAPIADPSVEATVEAAPARGAGAAGIGALLILLGVIPVVIGVRPRAVPRDRYMIGEGPDVHLPVALPSAAGEGVALVRALERQIVLGLVPGLTGQITDGERSTELADLLAQGRSSYALPTGATCEAQLGALRFTIQAVERAALEPARRSLDRLYFASNLGALALIGGALLLGEPRVAGELEVEEVAASRERAVRYLSELPPPPPPPEQPPPVLPDRPSRAAAKPTPPPPPSGSPPPATIDTLATEVAASAKIAPKGSRRGISNDYGFARTAGFLDDPAFNESVRSAQADAQEGLLGYDNEADKQMWAAVLAAPVIDRPFGGLTLAETERGGGLHDDRPKPTKGPAKRVEIDGLAKPEGPSAEARKLARRIVSIDFERPYVQGSGLASHEVQEAVRKQEAGLRQCFKEAVGTTDRTGTIIMVIKIGARGRVDSARLDFGGARLGDIGPCLTRVARGWKFPEPRDRKPFAIAIEGLFSIEDR